MIDARDGDTYRATTQLAYHAGTPYQLRVVADLSSHTFSAFVQVSSRLTVEIAHDFAFGPSQATATRLDTLASIVDTSDGATLQLCNHCRRPHSAHVRARRQAVPRDAAERRA